MTSRRDLNQIASAHSRIDDLERRLAALEDEILRRRGGRPRKTEPNHAADD